MEFRSNYVIESVDAETMKGGCSEDSVCCGF